MPAGEDDDTVPAFKPPRLLRVCDASGAATVEDIPVPTANLTAPCSTQRMLYCNCPRQVLCVGRKAVHCRRKERGIKAAMTYIDSPDSGCERGALLWNAPLRVSKVRAFDLFLQPGHHKCLSSKCVNVRKARTARYCPRRNTGCP